MKNTRIFQNGVIEQEIDESGKYTIATESTALVETEEGLQEVEGETEIFLNEGTRVYAPQDEETEIYDPDTGETPIWTNTPESDPNNSPSIGTPEKTKIYDPDSQPSDSDWPKPSFPNPSINSIKENYDWMFQRGLEEGYGPEESAKAASDMATTMAEVVEMLE